MAKSGERGSLGSSGSRAARTYRSMALSALGERRDGEDGVACGNSYIPRAKKCRKGAGAVKKNFSKVSKAKGNGSLRVAGTAAIVGGMAAAAGEPAILGATVASASVALAVANGKGLMSRVAVNKEDFDWPGNGKTSPEIESRYNTFKRGDLIENAFLLKGKYLRHYGVYAGKDPKTGEHMVYQVADDKKIGQMIKKEPLSAKKPIEFSAWRQTPQEERFVKGGSKPISRKDIIKRAESTVGQKFHYNVVRSNCEHYARAIAEGKAYSLQGERVSPLTRMAGDIVSVAMRKKVGRDGLTAREIASTVNQIESSEGKSFATNISLYLRGRSDSEEGVSLSDLGDLKNPDEFSALVEELTSSLPRATGDLVRRELYTNYLILISKMTSSGEEERGDAKRMMNRQGLAKKKIRTKTGVNRTYWVRIQKEDYARRQKGRKGTLRQEEPGGISPAKIAAVGVGIGGAVGASMAYAMDDIAEEFDMGDPIVTPEQKKLLEYTENGRPTAETYSRYESEFQPGDMIRKAFNIANRDAFHYAIYAGKNEKTGQHEIYQVGAPRPGGFPSPHIVKSPIHMDFDASPKSSMYQKVPSAEMSLKGGKRYSREEIMRRAEGLVGNAFDYQISKNNCESFARLIVEGQHYTTQGKNAGAATVKIFDEVSKSISKAALKKGESMITPEEAAAYLEELSKKKNEPFSYRDFIASKGAKKDSAIEDGLIPLSEILEKVRAEGLPPGLFQQRIEERIISQYLLLLVTRASLTKKRSDSEMSTAIRVCREIRQDNAARKGKKCPGGYWIPMNKQCGKGGKGKGRLKSPGGTALGVGVAGAALAAGGALAYKNREKIIAGVDKAGEKAVSATDKIAAKGSAQMAKLKPGVQAGTAKVQAGVGKVGGRLERAAEKTEAGYGKAAAKTQAGVRWGAEKASSGVRKGFAAAERGVEKARGAFQRVVGGNKSETEAGTGSAPSRPASAPPASKPASKRATPPRQERK